MVRVVDQHGYAIYGEAFFTPLAPGVPLQAIRGFAITLVNGLTDAALDKGMFHR